MDNEVTITEIAPAELFRQDGAFVDALAQYAGAGPIANKTTGVGVQGGGMGGSINPVYRLPIILLDELYRGSTLIQKIVNLLPADATKKWGELTVSGDDEVPENIQTEYTDYEDRLELKKLFRYASQQARHHGNHYIVLGIDDGRLWNEPVDTERIRTIAWARDLSCEDLLPDPGFYGEYRDPEHYQFSLNQRSWPDEELPRQIHKDRILKFCGVSLPESALEHTQGYDDSVLQAVYFAFSQFIQALGASSSMVADFSVFTYALEGLSAMLSAQDDAGKEQAQQALLTRFRAIDMGKSVTKGLMHDATNEKVDFINRTYSGVDNIVNALLDMLVTESGYPRSKLVGNSEKGLFSESGESDRYAWAELVETHQADCLEPNLTKVQEYIFAAVDGPTPTGGDFSSFGWYWYDTLQLTRKEQAELESIHARTDIMYMRAEVIHRDEIRKSRFGGAHGYSDIITISADYDFIAEETQEEYEAKKEAAMQSQNTPPGAGNNSGSGGKSGGSDSGSGSDKSSGKLNSDSGDFEALRLDAMNGLIPLEVYWEMRGYDVEKMQSARSTAINRRSDEYWERSY